LALREIITLPHTTLREKAHPVKTFDPEFQRIVNDMIETMRAAPGVGLAAPQVDVRQRVIVVEFGDEADETIPPKLYVVANPEIAETSGEKLLGVEGCLSIPNIVGEVERDEAVVVRGQNRRGKAVTLALSGWVARIFQHEIDHLEGVLFVDKASRIWKQETPPEGPMLGD